MNKISEEKLCLLRKRLLQGMSVSAIAEELQISVNTVKRYKKKSPAPFDANKDTGDNSIVYDYTSMLTKKEESFTKKIEAEISLYEDPEEGWVYHLTAHDHRLKQSGLWWSFIVYPDSAPEGWIDRLRSHNLSCAISPLHDKDTWNHDSPEMVNADTGEIIPKGARYKMGDKKKAHWHCICITDCKISYIEANNLLRKLTNCPYIQKCRSLRNAYDYFLHINSPEKYQGYFKDEIIKINNFRVEPNQYEKGIMFDEILTLVIDNELSDWRDVAKFYIGQPEYIVLLSAKPHMVTELLKSNWRKQNPEGKIQKVEIIEKKKDEVK